MEYNNVFEVKQNIERFGVWYALWFHGINRNALWTIFVASRMLKRENDAQRAHADWHYEQQLK
jgi:hypothetical protein